ncbi:MAG: hypothetical protein ACXVAY_01530 [Mucilaginibacter sp.]
METITITKQNAQKALKLADGELKAALTALFGGDQDPMEFESYEELCEAEEIHPILSLPFPSPQSLKEAFVNGAFKLATVFEAFNNRCGDNFDETWEPDYTDKKQHKHYPWGEYNPSLGAFVCTDTGYTDTITRLGARLCTNTDAKAKRIAQKFSAEWNEFLNPKL